MNIAVVGCTGKLGSVIVKKILTRKDVTLKYAIARRGNQYTGKKISDIINCNCELTVTDNISDALDCDLFIDCTNASVFMESSIVKYTAMKKPVVIATTAFLNEDIERIKELSKLTPIFMSGNFSIQLHYFLETLKFAVKNICNETDIQIIEYHHNQKKDAPSGTALMIREALVNANTSFTPEMINICSVRGGNIFGQHEVIFASCNDEVTSYKHRVFSRESFADGAIEVAIWLVTQKAGFYGMKNFCKQLDGK
ncbi:MAG TPA: 4-hydroxy-tetrahydrodipicolinate reductase [Lachnospiraceae bacterium]|nr:4-hydroxy-tetrahydrodipicolinate reductase [Lachnospiraceae bacterium]